MGDLDVATSLFFVVWAAFMAYGMAATIARALSHHDSQQRRRTVTRPIRRCGYQMAASNAPSPAQIHNDFTLSRMIAESDLEYVREDLSNLQAQQEMQQQQNQFQNQNQ